MNNNKLFLLLFLSKKKFILDAEEKRAETNRKSCKDISQNRKKASLIPAQVGLHPEISSNDCAILVPLLQKISGSAENETKEMPKIFLAQSSAICSLCEKEVSKGETLYQKEKSPKLFCSLSCLSKSHPHINFVIIKCYNCFQ